MLAHLQRVFEHMFWADDLVLELLAGSDPASPGEAVRLFSHLVAAERVWALRIDGKDGSSQAIWPAWTLKDTSAAAADSREEYRRILANLPRGGLQRIVDYTNSKGTPFRTPLVDILTHVAMHGSYHRGQVASAVRRAGDDPINTDYITYVRNARSASAHPWKTGAPMSLGVEDGKE